MAATGQLSPLIYFQRYFSGKQREWSFFERQEFYALAEAYVNNYAYERIADGGYRDYLLSEFGTDTASKVEGIYNPVQRVVDLYRYTLHGRYGEDIRIKPDKGSNILEPLEQIYRWSNFNIEKRALTHKAAALGTVGLRIVAYSEPSPRVYIKAEHPKRIKEISLDDRGNVEEVLLEYWRLEGRLGEAKEAHKITEYMSPEEFRSWRDDKPYDLINEQKNGELSAYENKLGVTPYVLLRHLYVGEDWGLPCWHGQAGPIDACNVLASHIDEQIRRHVRVKWFLSAAGRAPEVIDMGDTTVAYVQVDPSQPYPTPVLEPLVAPLNLADAITALDRKVAAIRDHLPELKATDGEFLSGQSGETIAQLRLPAEQLIFDARANYEDALIRANKLALSWGIRIGLWDLGNGKGSQQAAQQAYEDGLEDHTFEEREALPATAFEKVDLQNRIYTGIETLNRAGAISLQEMVKRANPEWTTAQVTAEVKRIEEAGRVTPPDTGSEGPADPLASFLGNAPAPAPADTEEPTPEE